MALTYLIIRGMTSMRKTRGMLSAEFAREVEAVEEELGLESESVRVARALHGLHPDGGDSEVWRLATELEGNPSPELAESLVRAILVRPDIYKPRRLDYKEWLETQKTYLPYRLPRLQSIQVEGGNSGEAMSVSPSTAHDVWLVERMLRALTIGDFDETDMDGF